METLCLNSFALAWLVTDFIQGDLWRTQRLEKAALAGSLSVQSSRESGFHSQGGGGEAVPLSRYNSAGWVLREGEFGGLGQMGAFHEPCWEENISGHLESQQIQRPKVSADGKDCKKSG